MNKPELGLISGWPRNVAKGVFILWMAAIMAIQLILNEPRVNRTRFGGKLYSRIVPLLITPERKP